MLARLRETLFDTIYGYNWDSPKLGIAHANLWSLLSFTWVLPLINKARDVGLEDQDGDVLLPASDSAPVLAAQFDGLYEKLQARSHAKTPLLNTITRTLLWLHWPTLLLHSFWTLTEIFQRLITPVILREFLKWLQKDRQASASNEWWGWVLAILLGVTGFTAAIVHHRLFWAGMRLGFNMRQQAIAAIHAKVLRLNSACVAHANNGLVVNLVSNDVRRFDDAGPFWVFVWAGPLELSLVLMMVSLELGFPAAIAGVGLLLLVIPVQALLVRTVGNIRQNTAQRTDERVRLSSEVIQGVLAMKMLSWENPFSAAIMKIRTMEARFLRQSAMIKAVNATLRFVMTALVAFVTFAVVRAQGRALSVPSVFYVLALLHLPELYMVTFFVMGVQSLAELRISLRRINTFLQATEPLPMPNSLPQSTALPSGAVLMAGADYDWQSRAWTTASLEALAQPPPLTLAPSQVQPRASLEGSPQPPPLPLAPSQVQPEVVADNRPATANGVELQVRTGGGTEAFGLDQEAGKLQLETDGSHLVGTGQVTDNVNRTHGIEPLSHSQSALDTSEPPQAATDMGMSVPGTHGTAGQRPVSMDTPSGATSKPAVDVATHLTTSSTSAELHIGSTSGGPAQQPLDDPTGPSPRDDGRREAQHGAGIAEPLASTPGSTVLTLCGVQLEVRPRELLAVVGEVGAGKSSLLAALLGELQPLPDEANRLTGGPLLHGSVAYCSQVPWIVAGTVRDNIVFGEAMDPRRYRRVVRACALEPDIAALPAGDMTELGERGINLSGGQKARVALARAAYSAAAIQLLDDPLSAVDPRVGRILFSHCIGPSGLMAGCTRILVTHQRQYLPECDRVLVLRGGRIAALGSWAAVSALQLRELVAGQAGVELAHEDAPEGRAAGDLVDDDGDDGKDGLEGGSGSSSTVDLAGAEKVHGVGKTVDPDSPLPGDGGGELALKLVETPSGGGVLLTLQGALAAVMGGSAKRRSLKTSQSTRLRKALSMTKGVAAAPVSGEDGKLVLAEEKAEGSVTWSVYGRYCWHMGSFVAVLVMVGMVAGQAVFLASEWWLALWARATPHEQKQDSWLWVYGLLVGLVMVLGTLRTVLFFDSTLRASSSIHNAMLRRLLRASLAFFHTNPAGRILNRFSKDQGQVDELLPSTLFDALLCLMQVLGAFVLVAVAVPVILPVFVPLLVAFWWYRQRYITASREVKRLEATSRSPVFANFSATLKGLPTIRAYGAQERFRQEFLQELSHNGAWWFMFMATARWIGFRLDIISACTLTAAAVLAMVMRGSVRPEILGLALTHVLNLMGLMQWMVRQTAEVENMMTSVERMLEYTELPQEPPCVAHGAPAPAAGWPSSGRLEYRSVTARYRKGLPPVLRGLSFSLRGGSSCGVVGRTGSGKSSLMLTLFRLIEVTEGSIWLDGVDASSIGLDALRRQLAIIPQDPVLFSGSLRSNLDPWDEHADVTLWDVLEQVQLRGAIQAAGGLHSRMAESGDNLSVGQRQLFCLARALLQRAAVLALDEATANVDRATDELIQQALRSFSHGGDGQGRLLLVIAHRIDTIMDCDHLLVLSDGSLVESGPPAQLTERPGGVFAGMVAAARHAAATPLPAADP